MKDQVEIEVESGGRIRRHVAGGLGRTLAEILADAGYPLNTRCNQRGLCRGCHVVLEGAGDVLACQHHLTGGESLTVSIPGRSLLSHPPSVVSDFQTGVPVGNDPMFPGALGVAVDIGTTTVAILLAELSSGKVLAKATALNAQVARGDNVLTRIQLCQTDKANIGRLKDDFWEKTFRPLLKQLFEQSGSAAADVAGMVVAGNTTMLHLACGVDPTPMGTVPFTPAFLGQRNFSGDEFGLPPAAGVVFLPGIAAYVGADISAGAACCGVRYGDRPQLLVDVGTNGEILLCGPSGTLACATAAGPAFEGCGLLCGMRAAHGVVGKISLRTGPFGVDFESIGGNNGILHGITGSAYVDFLAEGRRAGLLTENGRFDKSFVDSHPGYFRHEQNGLSFYLAPGHSDLRIGEVDVALLLRPRPRSPRESRPCSPFRKSRRPRSVAFFWPEDSASTSRCPMPSPAGCFRDSARTRSPPSAIPRSAAPTSRCSTARSPPRWRTSMPKPSNSTSIPDSRTASSTTSRCRRDQIRPSRRCRPTAPMTRSDHE